MRLPEALRPLLLVIAWAFALPLAAAAEDCAPDQVDLRDSDTDVRFHVEVMDTEPEREKGLMFRKSLPKFSGMLFVYESAQPVAFWMKNTLIPLDMLFFDGAGKLTRIKSQAQPLDETPVIGGDDVRYVLEINGGLAETLGIDVGAELRNPAVEGAAWSCSG
jgi:uncharacterized protein